jgi:hypothetical protein
MDHAPNHPLQVEGSRVVKYKVWTVTHLESPALSKVTRPLSGKREDPNEAC